MAMPPVHHAFLQGVTPAGCEERSFLDGRVNAARVRAVSEPHVIRKPGALERLRGAAGFLLKNAARLVYLAPLLLVVKLVLLFVDEPTSDLVVVAFVLLVVTFFVLLNAYIFLSVLWWLFGRDKASFELKRPFDDDGRGDLPLLGEGAGSNGPTDVESAPLPVGELVRARGTIVRLGPNREGDGGVLHDVWAEGEPGFRLTEAVDFAVVGRGKIPAVLRVAAAPRVVAKPAKALLGDVTAQISAATARLLEEGGIKARDPLAATSACAWITLREGDEVEVIGRVTGHIENVDGFELEGTYASVPLPADERDAGSTPFRDRPGGPGVILGDASAPPLLIRRGPA
jgi:hypothetical protein